MRIRRGTRRVEWTLAVGTIVLGSCSDPDSPPAPEGMGFARIDLLDGSGRAVGCVGM